MKSIHSKSARIYVPSLKDVRFPLFAVLVFASLFFFFFHFVPKETSESTRVSPGSRHDVHNSVKPTLLHTSSMSTSSGLTISFVRSISSQFASILNLPSTFYSNTNPVVKQVTSADVSGGATKPPPRDAAKLAMELHSQTHTG